MTPETEKNTESKLEVFEALLSEYLGASVEYNAHKWITEWRDRYNSADRYKTPH